MVKSKGKKITCKECGSKFYDLNKNPPECPKCKVEQAPAGKARRSIKKKPETKSDTNDTTRSGRHTFGLLDTSHDQEHGVYAEGAVIELPLRKIRRYDRGWY